MSAKDRVQQHRANLQGQYRRRLEVSIGITVIEQIRRIASATKRPLWSAVQDALGRYVEEFHTVVIEGQRLNTERARLLRQEDSPAHRHQVDEYNRQLAALNQRLTRFQQRHQCPSIT